jgi:hypothetical protein
MQRPLRHSGPVYLGADGRLTDGEGHRVFTDTVFADRSRNAFRRESHTLR